MPAHGHARNENYVWLNVRTWGLDGRFEIRLPDLRNHLGVQVAEDPDVARRQLPESAERIQSYLREHFEVTANGEPLEFTFTDVDVFDTEGELGYFAQYMFRIEGIDTPDQMWVRNDILFETHPNHRSLLCIEINEKTGQEFGGEFTALVFSTSNTQQLFDLTNIQGLMLPAQAFWQGVRAMVGQGYHLGFILLLLLLCTVVMLPEGDWAPMPGLPTALGKGVLLFSAFSLAHGLTLGLAGLNVFRAPGPLIELLLFLSLALMAVNNIKGTFRSGTVLVVFVLGLFHGLSLASTLAELPFRMMHLKRVLLGFTLGVEAGQAALVALVFPWIFLLRKASWYRPLLLVGASIAIVVVAAGTAGMMWGRS